MWIKHLFLGFIGLASGVGVAAGTFAFIIVIGVVPRMIAKCNRAENTILFENMIVLGGIFGTVMSVFTDIRLPAGHWLRPQWDGSEESAKCANDIGNIQKLLLSGAGPDRNR